MIRWLYPLSQFLREKGLLRKHPCVQSTNEDRLVLELDAEGLVRTASVTKQRVPFLRFGPYDSFPAFNLQALVTPPADFRRPLADSSWLPEAAEWPSSHEQETLFIFRWLQTAKNIAGTLKARTDLPPGLQQLLQLKMAMEKRVPADCLRQLLRQVAAAAAGNADVLLACCALFGVIPIGKGAERNFVPRLPERDGDKGKNCKVLVDHPGSACSLPDTWEQVSKVLFDMDNNKKGAEKQEGAEEEEEEDQKCFQGTCALSGKQGPCVVNWRGLDVPLFNPLRLFSIDRDTPALHHYGLCQGYAFPVLKEVACDIEAAVCFLWNRETEGKTWSSFPGQRLRDGKVKNDVLLLWVEEDPLIAAAPLGACGLEDEDDFQDAPRKVLQEIAQRLEGRVDPALGACVHYLVIRKVDKGNFRAVLHGNYLSSRWGASVEAWQRGCQELTGVYSKLSPMQCVELLGHSWRWSGDKEPCGYAPTMIDVWPVYLELADSADATRRLLQQTVAIHGNLLPLAYRRQLFPDQFKGKPKGAEKDAAKLRALLSLLLTKEGVTMDVLRESPAFNLGRLLLQVDGMRTRYGLVVRKKELTDSLGAEVSSQMIVNPLAGFNNLMERSKVYATWARCSEDELAKAFFAQFSTAAEKSAAILEDKPLTARQQAEFWLGFSSHSNRFSVYDPTLSNPNNTVPESQPRQQAEFSSHNPSNRIQTDAEKV